MDAVDVGERVCSEPGDLKYPSRYHSKSMMLVSWCRGVLSIMASIVIWGPSAAQHHTSSGGCLEDYSGLRSQVDNREGAVAL